MKSISLQAILMFLIMGTAFSQTENFEDETHQTSSFTVSGFNFTITGDLIVEVISGYGCNETDSYLSSGTGDGISSGSFGSIKVTNPGDKFTISTSLPWCAFTSANDGFNQATGDVKFTGTLSIGGTIAETFHVIPNWPTMTYDEITFSSGIWNGQELTELEVSIVSGVNYIALDNIEFENLIPVSVSNIQKEAIKIYPNPTAGAIEIIGVDDFEVKIIDAFGRIVSEQSLFNQKIDISDLLDGIYYIYINTHNQQITKRIIKH